MNRNRQSALGVEPRREVSVPEGAEYAMSACGITRIDGIKQITSPVPRQRAMLRLAHGKTSAPHDCFSAGNYICSASMPLRLVSVAGPLSSESVWMDQLREAPSHLLQIVLHMKLLSIQLPGPES